VTRLAQLGLAAGIAVALLVWWYYSPRMSEEAVVRSADEGAQKEGYKLSDYAKPRAHYEFLHGEHRTWTVSTTILHLRCAPIFLFGWMTGQESLEWLARQSPPNHWSEPRASGD